MATLRRRGGRSVTSSPPISTRPPLGGSRPARIRSVVVLPQPDGPSRTRNALGDLDREVDQDLHLVEPLLDGSELDAAGAHLPHRSGLEEQQRRATATPGVSAFMESRRATLAVRARTCQDNVTWLRPTGCARPWREGMSRYASRRGHPTDPRRADRLRRDRAGETPSAPP